MSHRSTMAEKLSPAAVAAASASSYVWIQFSLSSATKHERPGTASHAALQSPPAVPVTHVMDGSSEGICEGVGGGGSSTSCFGDDALSGSGEGSRARAQPASPAAVD